VLQEVEQLDQVPLERVRAALPMFEVILTEVPVEQGDVRDGEVPGDPAGRHPAVQVPGRADVAADRLFFVRSAIPVVDGPEMVLELGERRFPVA
jgi:hypothetical protein